MHPPATTFARYGEQTPHGLLLSSRLRLDQDPEGLAGYLACGDDDARRPVPGRAGRGSCSGITAHHCRNAGVLTGLG